MDLASISPCQMILIVNVIAFIIIDNKDIEELNAYANILFGIGSLIFVFTGQKLLVDLRNQKLNADIR